MAASEHLLRFVQNYWTITTNIKLSSSCFVVCCGFELNRSTTIAELNSAYVFEMPLGMKTRRESNNDRKLVREMLELHLCDNCHKCNKGKLKCLPSHVRSSETLILFKNNFKTHLFNLPSH